MVATSTGTIIQIGTTPGAPASDTFLEIGEVTDFGGLGKTFEKVEHRPVKTGIIEKLKGAFDSGTLNLQLARVVTDVGQVQAKVALDDTTGLQYNFRLEVVNLGKAFVFKGKVFEFMNQVGASNAVLGVTIGIEIDGEITEEDLP